eukprot:6204442-Pleurochrysis_carterae.AAC.2
MQMLAGGIKALLQNESISESFKGLRRAVRKYPLSSYLALATKGPVSSQPTFHAQVKHAFQSITASCRNLTGARAAEMRRNLPHGFTIIRSMLLLLMAAISRGDAAFANSFANLRDATQAQAIHAAVMQSMPAMAAAEAKSMWLGDTGAGMHCVTSASMAVAGSLRPNTTLIVTANGTTMPKHRCDVDLPLRTDKGSVVMLLRLTEVLVLSNKLHNLISLGRLTKEANVGLRVQATSGVLDTRRCHFPMETPYHF